MPKHQKTQGVTVTQYEAPANFPHPSGSGTEHGDMECRKQSSLWGIAAKL